MVLEGVKKTFEEITEEFSQTRQNVGKDFELLRPYFRLGATIADLGCGNGRFLKFLEEKTKNIDLNGKLVPYSYIGIDNNPKFIELAKKTFVRNANATFIEGDKLAIPLKDKSVDVVCNIRAFHHLPSGAFQCQALQEMKRILKPGGILIVTVWNLFQTKYRKELWKSFVRSVATLGAYHPRDLFISWGEKSRKLRRYYYAFKPNELKKMAQKEGFHVKELYYVKNGQKVSHTEGHDIVLIATL